MVDDIRAGERKGCRSAVSLVLPGSGGALCARRLWWTVIAVTRAASLSLIRYAGMFMSNSITEHVLSGPG